MPIVGSVYAICCKVNLLKYVELSDFVLPLVNMFQCINFAS